MSFFTSMRARTNFDLSTDDLKAVRAFVTFCIKVIHRAKITLFFLRVNLFLYRLARIYNSQ